MAETAYERFLKDPNKEEAVNIDIKDQSDILNTLGFKVKVNNEEKKSHKEFIKNIKNALWHKLDY